MYVFYLYSFFKLEKPIDKFLIFEVKFDCLLCNEFPLSHMFDFDFICVLLNFRERDRFVELSSIILNLFLLGIVLTYDC